MKHIRSLLFFLAAVFLVMAFTSNAVAQKVDDYNIALADVMSTAFSDSTVDTVSLLYPDTAVLSTEDTATAIGANRDSLVIMEFMIFNGESVDDTLQTVRFTSASDTTDVFSRIALYREGVGTPLMETDPGSFAENEELAFSGLGNIIEAGDTAIFYFEADINSAAVDAGYDSLFAGIKISGGDIVMALAGTAPAAGDILIYESDAGANGRLYYFDTKPPDLTIGFDWIADDGGGCVNNNIVNLGDSVIFYAWDSVGQYEIDSAWAYLSIFGVDPVPVYFDTITVSGSDSAAFFEWMIPDTAFAGAADIAAGFYWLKMGAIDASGNSVVDSILLPYAIDTKAPVFDGDSVWVSLYYDANGDGIAAVGDTVAINAWMTSNPFGEISTVTANLTNWGYGSAIPLLDQSGDRKYINYLELTAGTLDMDAGDSASLFWITATDNACNHVVDSNIANFAIDNEPPAAPTITYTREYDWDTNNIIDIGDSVKITVDPTGTDDLDTVCQVSVDLLTSGLGGTQVQCITDTTAAGVYTYTTLVRSGGIYAVDDPASTHQVTVTLTDDAGNTTETDSPVMLYPVDTERPGAVANLSATRGACSISLDWDAVADAYYYFIFWDGGDGWDASDTSRDANGNLIFLDTLGSVAAPASAWTTDGTVTLDNGTTYQFVVRTVDDANNAEYNFHRVAETADCQAPVACITNPASGGAYGTNNDLDIIAESTDPDIDGVMLWIRIADLGSGTPGPWIPDGTLDRPGGGGVFTYTIDSAFMDYFGCVDDTYDLVTTAVDEVGNAQDTTDAIDTCGIFTFDWFCTALPVELISINDAVSPQTSCGFDVTRDANNTVEINVADFVAGETYTVDVWTFKNTTDPLDSTREVYVTGVDAMPYTFNLDCTEFPKNTVLMKVRVTRDDGNMNTISADLCVPDEDAPMATIVRPFDGQYVRQSCTMLDRVNVWARINYDSYDFTNTTKVEFYDAAYTAGEAPVWTTPFAVITTMTAGDSTWRAMWNNCSYENGDVVALAAVFYDDKGNTYETPFVKVTIDAELPDVALTTDPEALDLCGNMTLHGTGNLVATVTSTPEDIDSVVFFYCLADSPDLFDFYHRIGQGEPASSDGIYKYFGFNTSGMIEGRAYRFRAIAYDITGQVMYDYDGDGIFDDNTFDAVNNTSDGLFMIDNSAVQFAISQVDVADGPSFPTPSELLSGAGRVYAPMGSEVTVQSMPVPMGDTCCLGRLTYYFDDAPIASSEGPMPYEITFDPMNYIDPKDFDGDYYEGTLTIEFTDCFGQTSDDEIDFYLLDGTANDVVFVGPFDGDCVEAEQWLYVMPVSDFDVERVDYFYRAVGETEWNLIGSSTNSGNNFPVYWPTAGLEDGQYELGAVSYDPSGNASDPTIITVNVANTPPEVAIISPEDMAYVATETPVEAEVISGSPERMVFQYKPQTSDSWQTFGTDFHEPWVSYFDATSDGYYHLMVRARNCGDALGQSEIITVFLDNTDPFVRITSVNGTDAGQNDPDIDVTGMSEVTTTAYVVDDRNDSGNSGLAQVGFYLYSPDADDPVRVMFQDAVEGQDYYTGTFDITGLGIGTYYLYARGIDNVGNWDDSRRVTIHIYDETAPTVAIAGYYGGALYGYDWSGDATSVLFQRYDSENSEWVGIGIGQETNVSGLWATAWSPDAGTYTLRVISSDGANYDDENVLTVEFTMDDTYSFGTSNITLAEKKNTSSDDLRGVVRTESPNGEPFVFGVYAYDNTRVHQAIMLDPNLQNGDLYYGSFNANDIGGEGEAVFFSSYPNAAGDMIQITMSSFMTYEILPDFGTNGVVEAFDGDLTLSVDDGSTYYTMTAVMMETWIPQAGIDQDEYEVVPNPNGYGWYVGCNDYYDTEVNSGKQTDGNIAQGDYYCCFDDNKYATITMYYDPEETSDASTLAVAWWDDSNNEWSFDGILYPAFVEGFNTTDHYVQFASECLHGLYAVVKERDLPQSPSISIDLIGDMYCGYFEPYPYFVLNVKDLSLMKEIDTHSWNVSIDDYPIAENGNISDYFDFDYDEVTNLLTIEPDYYYYDNEDSGWYYYYNNVIESLSCGAHTLTVGVKNIQGAYREEAFDFTIDCAPPTVTFENGYVGKNPTIQFYLTDDLSGIDTSSIHVDVLSITKKDPSIDYCCNDELFFLQTFFPGQITIGEDGMVSIPTTFDLNDGEDAIVVVLYDGTRNYSYDYADPVAYDDWDEYYSDSHGIHDCAGNAQTPIVQIFAVDVQPPTITVIGQTEPVTALAGCVKMKVSDTGGGIEADNISIYEDGVPIERVAPGEEETGTYSYNPNTSIITYCVTPGADITVEVTDNAGNTISRDFGSGNPTDIVDASLSMNPWDPRTDGVLVIDYNFTGTSEVKIYDFGGDLVKTLRSTTGMVQWNGTTEDGTTVASGVYFGYITAMSDSGTYSTFVKIAVVQK